MERPHLGATPDFRVVSAIETEEAVEALVEELEAMGFVAHGHIIGIHHGEEGKDFIDPDGSRHGLLGKIVRATQRLGSWQASMIEQTEEALNAGHYAVSVLTDGSKQQRLAIRDAIQKHTKHAIYYQGQSSMEILRRAGDGPAL